MIYIELTDWAFIFMTSAVKTNQSAVWCKVQIKSVICYDCKTAEVLARVEQNDVTVLRPVLWILGPRRDVSTSCEPHFPACCATTSPLLTLNKRQLSSNCTSSLKYHRRFVGLKRDTLALTCMNVISVLWCNEVKDFFITELMLGFLSPLLHLTSSRNTVYYKNTTVK